MEAFLLQTGRPFEAAVAAVRRQHTILGLSGQKCGLPANDTFQVHMAFNFYAKCTALL